MGVSAKDQGGLNGNAAPKGHPMHRKRHRMTFCVWNSLPGIKVDAHHCASTLIPGREFQESKWMHSDVQDDWTIKER